VVTGSLTTPSARGGFGPSSIMGSSQPGGPGNYNPPIEKTPTQRQGTPGTPNTTYVGRVKEMPK
jgi:hypothetical protein